MGQCVSTAHLASLQDQISDAEGALKTYRSELSERKEQLVVANAATTASRDEVGELKLQIRDLTVQRDVKDKQREELEGALRRKAQEADGEKRVLEAAKQEALRDVHLRKREIDRLNMLVVEAEGTKAKARQDLDTVQAELTASRASIEEQATKIGSLESGNAALREEMAVLTAAVAEIDAATAQLNSNWAAQMDAIRTSHAAELSAATADQAATIASLQAELTTTQATHADTLKHIQVTHTSLLQEHSSAQHQSEASLQATAASLAAQLAATQAQHAATTAELDRARREAKREILDVRGSVSKSASRFERVRAEHEILLQSSKLLQAELDKARAEIHQLKSAAPIPTSAAHARNDSRPVNAPATPSDSSKRTDSPMRDLVQERLAPPIEA